MGFFDNIKSFVHSITTEDHYASYGSPYKDSMINGTNNSSTTRLNELNNRSSASLVHGEDALVEGRNAPYVNYRPGLRSSNTNLNGSELQLQNLSRDGQPPLPSIDSLWDRLERWLDEEYPELYDNLNDGVTSADLNEFEKDLGCGSLPVEFRQLYKRCDGQLSTGKPTGLFMGLVFLDLGAIMAEHAIWLRVAGQIEKHQFLLQKQHKNLPPVPGDESLGDKVGSSVEDAKNKLSEFNLNNTFIAHQRSIPPNSIQPFYSHKGWVPICRDYFGNLIAVDLVPGPQGNWGQVIVFGRDFDTKLVVAYNLQEFLFNFVTDLENGNYQIDKSEMDTSYGYLESSRTADDFYGDDDEDKGELMFYDKDKEFSKAGGLLTYLEVLKRRTLKKHGVTNASKFTTSFIPEPAVKRTQEVKSNTSSVPVSKVSSPLINIDSSSKVNLPKETIIGADESDEKVLNDVAITEAVPVKEDAIKEESPKESALEEPIAETLTKKQLDEVKPVTQEAVKEMEEETAKEPSNESTVKEDLKESAQEISESAKDPEDKLIDSETNDKAVPDESTRTDAVEEMEPVAI